MSRVRRRFEVGPEDERSVKAKEDTAGNSEDVEPASNLGTMQMMKGGRSGSAHGETKLSYIPVTRFNPFNQTEQVLMTYYQFSTGGSLATGTALSALGTHSFRLNSIYDCETISTYVGDPSPAADTADGTINTPTMRSYWMNFYRYWSVVGSRYRFRVRCNNGENGAQLAVYVYEHGLQRPPVLDTASTPALITHQYKRMHPNLKQVKYVNALPLLTTSGVMPNYNNYWETIEGTFSPGSINHEVVEDEYAQVWHTATEVPPTPECVTLHIQRSPVSSSANALTYYLETTIEYIVQLKDLKAEYQYIHSSSDLSAVSNFAAQAN